MKSMKLGIMIFFYPITAFLYMKKERDKFNPLPGIVCLLLAICVKLFAIYFTHYPLASVSVRNANLFWECAKLFVPILTWVLASYAMTTILDGETLLREAFLAMTYALLPYIIFTVPLTLLSQIMEQGQGNLYYSIQNAIILWVILLLLISLKEMNHYSVGKTLLVVFLSIFTMAIIWAATAMFFSISMQFISFVKEVIVETRYKFY